MSRIPFLTAALIAGCGVKKYLPQGPVLSPSARDAWTSGPSGATYTSPPRVPFPVLPLQVWGVTYDLDLVLESTHDRYDMHEYARIRTADGPVWLAKDALSASKTQSIIADLQNLDAWVPEMPIERKTFPLTVEDQSTEDWLDLTLSYENLEDEPVVVHYEGTPPTSAQKKRNGNTMGHSANVAMAVLDIPYRDFAERASVQIDGEDYKIRKLLGLVKLQVALVQTQGGLSVSRFDQRGDEGGFQSLVWTEAGELPLDWEGIDGDETLEVRQDDGFRTLAYTFDKTRDGAALELSAMRVFQFGTDLPILTISLSPALPDLRRDFDGRHISRFVVDVNDQRAHAIGRLEAFWEGDEAHVLMVPEKPKWVADRPMETTIRFGEVIESEAEPLGEPAPPVFEVSVEIVRTPKQQR